MKTVATWKWVIVFLFNGYPVQRVIERRAKVYLRKKFIRTEAQGDEKHKFNGSAAEYISVSGGNDLLD